MNPSTSLGQATVIPRQNFRTEAVGISGAGGHLLVMFAQDERKARHVYSVHAVFLMPDGELRHIATELPEEDPTYPALTAEYMPAHWYERLMRDQFGIEPVGHPDLRPLMHHENIPEGTHPLKKDFAWNTKLAHGAREYPMHHVAGRGVYEVPVGPIHAGIIEPGHFRFNVRGERILALEGKLFFKHKGVEKLLEGKTPEEAMPFVERISGDMVIGHTLAFVQAVESVSGVEIPARARYLRSLYNELERITMHVFDIGNMGGNGTGFTFMAAQGFRMVEELRRLHHELVGHRFLRGAITLGGAHDLSDDALASITQQIGKLEKEMGTVTDIAFRNDGLMERFETTGVLTKKAALAYGAMGVPARASGVDVDLRRDMAYAAYGELQPAVCTESDGDVAARFRIRVRELTESLRLVRAIIAALPKGVVQTVVQPKEGSAFGWSEAWRGGIVDFVALDSDGKIERAVIRDPSFCNWPLFGEIGPGNIVPDFPLCNKSLNLSYSGNDL